MHTIIAYLYVNIHPLIQQLASSDGNSRNVFSSLVRTLELLPNKNSTYHQYENISPSSLISGGVGAFETAIFEGDTEFHTSSGIVHNIDTLPIDLYVDGKRSTVENVSKVIPIDTEKVTIKGVSGGVLEGGYGFYSLFSSNKSSLITAGRPSIILLEFANSDNESNSSTVVAGNKIRLDLKTSSILLRQPKVFSNGISDFKNFFAYGELNNKVPALGQDFKISGRSSFSIDFSDKFAVIDNASFDGKFLTEQRVNPYNELKSLSSIFSLQYARHVILVVILVSVAAIFLLEKKGQIRGMRDSKKKK